MADDHFLARWSKRKQAVAREEATARAQDIETKAIIAADAPAAEQPALAGDVAVDPDAPDRARHPAEDIDIASLTKESDFTIFMEKGVPALVKQAALRKLWTSDPVLANLDGLNDYEDMEFTYGMADTAGSSGWQLGRGFQSDEDLARYAREGGFADTEDDVDASADETDDAVVADVDDAIEGADEASAAPALEGNGTDDAIVMVSADDQAKPAKV